MNPLIETVKNNEKHRTRFVSVQYGPTKRGAVGVYTMILADYGRIIRRDLAQVKSLKDVDLGQRPRPRRDRPCDHARRPRRLD